jgi:uncharacterized protein YbjT (DUF2867 family)
MILITGATGHVGRELVPQLLQAGHPVRVLVRDPRKVAALDPSVQRAVGDLDRPETLGPTLDGVESLFLVTFETRQDAAVLAAARQAGVRRVVKLSTLEATDAVLQIGKWSRERERLIEASGLEWTFLRPGMFMTNTIDWWADAIRAQGGVYFPGGAKGQVAPIDPADVAAVAALALTQPGHNGQAYELTGAQLFTMGEMVAAIGCALGKPLKYNGIPPFAAKMWMLQSGMDKTLMAALMELLSALRQNKGAQVTDIFERLTGRPPRSFEAWCREHVAAFQ